MTGHEEVIGALQRIRIAHQATTGTDRIELVISSCDQFMGVDLVPGIPDQTVMAEIEYAVQGKAQLDDPQIRCEMRGTLGNQLAENLADLSSQFLQIADRHILQRAGVVDFREQSMHGRLAVPFQDVTGKRFEARAGVAKGL